ncbi:MAG: hypothetical protein GXP33_04830 [Spirochaetes bacterium]|nr:hypothetical protein [Spirochaetota bacterium]
MFGRHVVGYDQKGLFPTDSAIKILNITTGNTIKKIKIPGGSKMTPAIYKNTILMANQQGVFYKINPNSGKIITKLQTKAVQPVAVAVTVHGDKAFFPGRRGTIVCINLAEKTRGCKIYRSVSGFGIRERRCFYVRKIRYI